MSCLSDGEFWFSTCTTKDEKTSTEKLCQSDWPEDKSLGHFLDFQLMVEGLTYSRQINSWESIPIMYKVGSLVLGKIIYTKSS